MNAPHVILTSKPGQFSTVAGRGLQPIEAWEYWFGGRLRARFVIARLDAETRIEITDEAPPRPVNRIPTRLLPRFATLQAARDEIACLAVPVAGADTRLVRAAV
ncbi:MAG: ferredoxin [Rubrivivax sp.]|nr:ferredoxin [Rubrivivax sp.]